MTQRPIFAAESVPKPHLAKGDYRRSSERTAPSTNVTLEQENGHVECQLRHLIARLGRSAGGQWRVLEVPPVDTTLARKRA